MKNASPAAVRDVVKTICGRMGKRFEDAVDVVAERPGQDAAYVIDSTKARTEFGWRPEIDLDQGIADTASWVEANWAAIAKQSLDYQHKA